VNWQAKVFPVLLSLSTMIAGAQSTAELPLPEITMFVRQAVAQQRFAESREQDYVFREDTNDIRLKKECTWAPKCPAPFGEPGVKGVAYQVVQYAEHHFEIFWLDGFRVARVLPACDRCGTVGGPVDTFIRNIPISSSELAVENQRVDSEVAEAKALRAQGKDAGSPEDPPQILLSRMLELSSFSNPRRQVIEGRTTIMLDFAWNPSEMPVSANETLLKFFSGAVGIDEEDHAVQHLEGRFLADVNIEGGNIKIRKGTRLTITNRRVETGIWLQSRVDAWGEGRYFAFAIDGAGHIFTGNYRKFHTTSKILPGYTVAPTDSHSPSTANPSPAPAVPH
jgi:hypothetical protein